MIIDLIVRPDRWVNDARYRQRMLRIPEPPCTWRLVCRNPEGGVQIVACIRFLGQIMKAERVPLRKVKR